MQWLCLFAVLLVLCQPAEAGGIGKRFELILAKINETDAMYIEKLDKVMETLATLKGQCTYKRDAYLGCFEDKSARLLPKMYSIEKLTNQKCVDKCAEEGYKYAGTEYSSQCFCGNCYEKYPQKPESDCSYKCTGDDAEKCGGFWRISVTATGK